MGIIQKTKDNIWYSFKKYYTPTPIILTAYKGIGGIELGSQEFAVK